MILSGLVRLGADAELRYTSSGDAVLNLRAAWNYGKKDQQGKTPSQWADLSLWGKRAEALAPHLLKGTQIFIVAEEPNIQEWDKQDGTKGYKLTARVSSLEFAGNAKRTEQNDADSASKPAQQQQRQAPAHRTAPSSAGGFNDMEDDIPF